MKSGTIKLYSVWLEGASPEAVEFVDAVYALCEKHYSAGGDTVVECMGPNEVLETFKSLRDVRSFCGLRVSREADCRWGEDSDPEVARLRAFDEWK